MMTLTLATLGLWAGAAAAARPIPELKLPPGFRIEVFAEGLAGARSLALGAEGTVFVLTGDEVYAVRDGKRSTVVTGLQRPAGIAFGQGALFVAELQRITRYDGIETRPQAVAGKVIREDLPVEIHHGSRYLAFGPDGKLYLSLGAPCNICVAPPFEAGGKALEGASITRMNPDGSQWEVVARGVRNSVGFDWHPLTKQFWFTDNGRDRLGDDLPACELNRLGKAGEHFGFPYCHQGDLLDPEFGQGKRCADFVAPAARMGPHVAPLGMRFYTGRMFPERYRNQVLVAEHGSWNRSRKSGYLVSLVRFDAQGRFLGKEPFVEGWLKRGTLGQEFVSGRPVDVLVLADGSVLISDDYKGRVYRVFYKP